MKETAWDDGFSSDQHISESELKHFSDAVIFSTDWTTETIVGQLQKANIDVNPKFQRRDAWKKPQKSQYIESLILNIPTPNIILAETKSQKGKYIVIDGKQRLSTLKQFAASSESFKLSKLPIRTDLNGKNYFDLLNDFSFEEELNSFQNQTIRTVVIRNWQSEAFLHTVFYRLNTGSVKLSPQELRQALHPGPFVDFVDDTAVKSDSLKQLLNKTDPDPRMRDTEMIVRYYAFRNFLDKHTGDLRKFFDYTCQRLNKLWETQENDIKRQADTLTVSIQNTYDIFGEEAAFRKWEKNKYGSVINKAVFDIMIYYFSDKNLAESAKLKSDAVKEEFKKLCDENTEFFNAITVATSTLDATHKRLAIWGGRLKQVLGKEVNVPSLEDGRINTRLTNVDINA